MMEQHAANAYRDAMQWAARGYAPLFVDPRPPWNEFGDDLSTVCYMIAAGFPDMMRDRLDAVLEGLHAMEFDPTFETRFLGWHREWVQRMELVYRATSNIQSKQRQEVRLVECRSAAKAMFPELIEWFDDIREQLFRGGQFGPWLDGDSRRGAIGVRPFS